MAEGKLREVEEDATYITQKRFDEHYAEQARESEKKNRAEQKVKSDDVKLDTKSEVSDSKDK